MLFIATFSWKPSCNDRPSIVNIAMNTSPGQLVGVIGKVGSGKVCHNTIIKKLINSKVLMLFIELIKVNNLNVTFSTNYHSHL